MGSRLDHVRTVVPVYAKHACVRMHTGQRPNSLGKDMLRKGLGVLGLLTKEPMRCF